MHFVIWQIHTQLGILQSYWVGCAMLASCGIMMASRLPTVSAKNLRIPARRIVPFLLSLIFAIGMLVSQFWLTLGIIGILYLLSIPVCGVLFLRQRRRFQAQQAGLQPVAIV